VHRALPQEEQQRRLGEALDPSVAAPMPTTMTVMTPHRARL
jgi:hypothetical protein